MKRDSLSPAFRLVASVLSVGTAAIFAVAMPAAAGEPHHTVVPVDTVKWGPAPASLPPGAQASVLFGDPSKEGAFVLRLKFPDGFVVPPHRHTKDEPVTVISGRLAIGAGEKMEKESMHALPAASFVHLPAGMPHYAAAQGETIVQINGIGPFDIVYVDPAQDPRKQ